MTNLITEARELCEKATPGPWESGSYGAVCLKSGFKLGNIEGSGNAAFIARSRTLIPELCDALENTEKQLQEQFDKTGAWLEEYNEMKIALEKAEAECEQMKTAISRYCRNDCYRDACTGNEDVGIPDCPMAKYAPPLPAAPEKGE